ncbi:condensin complex subunit 3, partial [Brachionus plicatilis]
DLEHTQSQVSNNFLISLINYLIDHKRANCDATRYRVCHILSGLMSVISNDQSIDEDLFDRLCDAMLERLKDINSRVQLQAISAIYRLQDPTDRDCRVIKALLFLMAHDPNWKVRFQALSKIVFCEQTLPEIIDRVRDPHLQVRRKAILILLYSNELTRKILQHSSKQKLDKEILEEVAIIIEEYSEYHLVSSQVSTSDKIKAIKYVIDVDFKADKESNNNSKSIKQLLQSRKTNLEELFKWLRFDRDN